MTMFRNTFKSALLASVVFLASACDSWLYLEPQDAIVKQEFWKTKEQVQSAVYGAYASLLAPGMGQSMFLWGELRGDMIAPNPTASQNEIEVTNGNILDTNPLVNWAPFYRSINYANTVLQFAPQAQANDPTFKEDQLNGYMGEMRALRSLLYFYLVRSFGDVPLKLAATVSDDQDLQIPKSPQATVLQQIRADLARAEKEVPLTYGSVATDKGRITRYAVNAMQADVYLWSELYDSALIAIGKIESSGKFGLVLGESWYRSNFVVGNSNESIFELQFGTQQHPLYPMISQQRRFSAAPHVLEEMYTIDFLIPENQDLRSDGGSIRADGSIWKYMGVNNDTRRENASPYPNWVMYRYADVLLMKAEALAQPAIDRGPEALEIVDRIRTRANALPASAKSPDPTDHQGVLDYILEERGRELAFEGKRWYDLLRHAKRNNYERLDILTTAALKSAPSDRQQTIVNKFRDKNSHYFPIYTFELQTNKNLVQNPFYQ